MKKLIIAAALMASAMFVNAASVSWQSGVTFGPGAEGAISYTAANRLLNNSAVTMYVFATAGSELNSYKAGDGYKWVTGGSTAPVAVKSQAGTDGAAKVNGNTGIVTSGYAADAAVRAVIVFTYTDAKGKEWYLENTASVTIDSLGSDGSVANLFRYKNGSSAAGQNSSWTAAAGSEVVPEPTSSLLLLVGIAGLALRRRRA